MLKPITEEEKAKYTFKIQLERAVQELLSEAYESGYEGYIDIWPEMKMDKKRIIFEVKSNRVLLSTSPQSASDAMRYHIAKNKGCKRIK